MGDEVQTRRVLDGKCQLSERKENTRKVLIAPELCKETRF